MNPIQNVMAQRAGMMPRVMPRAPLARPMMPAPAPQVSRAAIPQPFNFLGMRLARSPQMSRAATPQPFNFMGMRLGR